MSAPKYSLSIRTKDAKLGEKTLREASEDIAEKIKPCGEAVFKVE